MFDESGSEVQEGQAVALGGDFQVAFYLSNCPSLHFVAFSSFLRYDYWRGF
jgi:hypothetical protein